MKYLLILTVLHTGLLASCDRNDYTKTQKTKADAYLANDLAADGCSWHFSGIENERYYAANDASWDKIDALIKSAPPENGMYRIPVYVEFSLTGSKKAVQCGWGRKSEMEEINIYSLKIRKE